MYSYVWLISLNVVLVRVFHVSCRNTLFILIAVCYSTVLIHYSLSILLLRIWVVSIWVYYKQCCHKYSYICLLVNICMYFSWVYIQKQNCSAIGYVYVQLQQLLPVFQSGCTILCFPSRCSTSLPTCGIVSLFHFNHTGRCVVVLHYDFNLHFHDDL